MPAFPKVVITSNSSVIDGIGGFFVDIQGVIGSAGDLNGDGYADLIYGSASADEAFVVYGHGGAFMPVISEADLDGGRGFKIVNSNSDLRTGYAVGSAGDFNNDGRADLLVSADPNGVGQTYVLYGPQGGFGAEIDLADVDGSNGFRFDGVAPQDGSGGVVQGLGDFNGDGIDDVLISAPGFDTNGLNDAGQVSILFGTAAAMPAVWNSGDLDGGNGFNIPGLLSQHYLGLTAASAGDLNGDGLGDVVIGEFSFADNDGTNAYVVFGSTAPGGASFDLSALDGSNGFKLGFGEVQQGLGNYGVSCAAAGDVNGDGIGDLIVEPNYANPGTSAYVLYGSVGGFPASIDLTKLDGADGFAIRSANGHLGGGGPGEVAAAGDFNGDGFDDILLNESYFTGGAALIFGRGPGAPAHVNVERLNGSNGIFISTGVGSAEVAYAGDVNGDGFDDVSFSFNGKPGILFGSANGSLLYSDSLSGTAGADFMTGEHADDTLKGRGGDDTINGGVGDNRLFGEGGDDLLICGEGGGANDGGAGFDTASYADSASALIVQASAEGFTILKSDGAVDSLIRIEVVIGSELDDGFSGSVGKDNFIGGRGDDHLSGLSGADGLDGGDGDDWLEGGSGKDQLQGGLGNDLLTGGSGRDLLDGGLGPDRLDAGAGIDTLIGNGGGDVLIGGGGHDTFRFLGVDIESGGDRILDLQRGDIIDLSAIDANLVQQDDQAFVFVGQFSGQAGELMLRTGGGATKLLGDIDGDGIADLRIFIEGDHAGFSNFVL